MSPPDSDDLDPDLPLDIDAPGGEPGEPLQVPWRLISADALRRVVEAFVLREGTDYGAREFSHDEKVLQVLDGLERGEVQILFDPATETVTLRPRPAPASRIHRNSQS